MAPFISITEDALFLILALLQPEDLLHLVQTCKSLHELVGVKAFWLICAKELQRRRRVHYLPLEQLDIPQLRKAVFHTLRLDSKWSGREDVDPSPLRCVEIAPLSYAPARPSEKQAVTWVWFLEDGMHLTCVVDDEVVQLWNLQRNKPILSFDVCGTLVRASQYSDKDHFVVAASVDTPRGDDEANVEPTFVVWKYRWDTPDVVHQLLPCATHPLPVHPTSICLTGGVAGAVYATDTINPELINKEKDPLGYLTFLLVEWNGSCVFSRRFTPLSFFGVPHAEQWRSDMAHCVRNASHFVIIFESVMNVEVYAYDWHLFEHYNVQQVLLGMDIPDPRLVYPRLKVAYALGPEHSPGWHTHRMQHSWSQPCLLWDGIRVGILGYFVSLETHKSFITLSVLDLQPIIAYESARPNYGLQQEYHRRFVDNGVTGHSSYTTTDNRFLGSQPRYATNTVWAVRNVDQPPAMVGLAFGRFSLDISAGVVDALATETGIVALDEPVEELEGYDLRPQQKVAYINMPSSLPTTERAEDIDLDDRLGKVAFGMESGKVFILEFV